METVIKVLLLLHYTQDVLTFAPNTIPLSTMMRKNRNNNSNNNNHDTRTRIANIHTMKMQGDNDIIDAEFYSTDNNTNNNDNDNDNDNDDTTKKSNNKSQSTATQSPPRAKQISALQASLLSVDSKLSSLSFNFIDPSPLKSSSKQRFIPCRAAYTVTHNDIDYILGTPVDTQVGIYVEDRTTNQAYFLDPDEDDNMEIMERAASVFQVQYEHISLSDLDDEDVKNQDGKKKKKNDKRLSIRFKRTPRTLTVEGDLSMITGNWKNDEMKQFNEMKNVAKSVLEQIGSDDVSDKDSSSKDDDDDAYFDSFFTKELGNNYEEAALANRDLDEQADEMMEFFNIPGLGTEKNDDGGIKDLIGDIFNGKDEELARMEEEASGGNNGNGETETALRLIGFSDEGDGGKVYSLVQLLQPMILVAKNDPSLEPDERMLLTPREADEIIPILEKQFEEEFGDAGISLKP